MATKTQDFLIKSTDIRKQINSEFDHLIERVNARRNELLSKLDDVVSSYQRLVRESEQALEQLTVHSRAMLNLNLTQRFQNAVMYGVENEIADMKREMSNIDLSFEWTDDFKEMIVDLGTIIVNFNQFDCGTPKIDYSLMNTPKISKPIPHHNVNTVTRCICIDPNTLYIYVSHQSPPGVFVFDKNGDYLLKFGETLSSPYGIAILGDKIYFSNFHHNSITKYRLCGTQTPKLIKTPDISKTELKNPTLMSIDESDCHVYVCDTENRRVVRYNKFLNYHSEICGKDNFTPLNVKITQTRIILFVKPAQTSELASHPIRLYSKDKYQFLKSLFIECKGTYFDPKTYFDIDTNGNFLVSLRPSIGIYDGEGILFHELRCNVRGVINCFASNRKTGSLVITSNMLHIL